MSRNVHHILRLSIIFGFFSILGQVAFAQISYENGCPYYYSGSNITDYAADVSSHIFSKLAATPRICMLDQIECPQSFSEHNDQLKFDQELEDLSLLFWNSPEHSTNLAMQQLKLLAEQAIQSVDQLTKNYSDESGVEDVASEETFSTPEDDFYDYVSTSENAINQAKWDQYSHEEAEIENPRITEDALARVQQEVADIKESEVDLITPEQFDLYGYEQYNCFFEMLNAEIVEELDIYDDSELTADRTPESKMKVKTTSVVVDPTSDAAVSILTTESSTAALNQSIDFAWITQYFAELELSMDQVMTQFNLLKEKLFVTNSYEFDLETIESIDELNQQAADYRGKVVR